MKLKKIVMLTNMFIVLILLTACKNNVESSNLDSINSENLQLTSGIIIPKKLQIKLNKNISLDATVVTPTVLPNKVKVIPAQIMNLKNLEKVKQILFANQSFSKVHEESFQYRDGKIGKRENYKAKSGDFLNWEGKGLSCGKALLLDIQEAFNLNGIDTKLYSAKDLPFMSQKEAEKKARGFLETLGVRAGDNLQIYALDYKTMEREQIKHQKEANYDELPLSKRRPIRKWTQADDCYVFCFYQEIDGVMISGLQQFGSRQAQTQTRGPMIVVYYGTQGIVNAIINNVYAITDSTGQSGSPIGLDRALDVLVKKIDDVIMDSSITVTEIEFSYVPKLKSAHREDYYLTPAWIFQLSQYSKDINKNVQTKVIINALTGKEME